MMKVLLKRLLLLGLISVGVSASAASIKAATEGVNIVFYSSSEFVEQCSVSIKYEYVESGRWVKATASCDGVVPAKNNHRLCVRSIPPNTEVRVADVVSVKCFK
jgi:hypothetical protein